jgi:hypothetical protein
MLIMQFNQVNKNLGDVNNAIAEKGSVVQTTGDASTGKVTSASSETGNVVQTSGTSNKVQVDRGSKSFWGMLWKKLQACWKWFVG